MRIISIEEHFATPAFIAGPGKAFYSTLAASGPVGATITRKLTLLGAERIADMDEAGIDTQVLSLNSPGVEQAEADDGVAIARDANDFLFEAIEKYPSRLGGFASLPIQAAEKAADELTRCVSQLGFKGANINGHARGRYLDHPSFSPILETAEKLGVPIYLHPTAPPTEVVDALYGGFSPAVSRIFATNAWGWHIETATHLLRLILGGVFDRYPALQVVIGHMGEAIPFMAPRLHRNLPQAVTKLARPLMEYLRTNVHYTFGGFNFDATFANLYAQVGAERILFSADYPFGSMTEAREFLLRLPLDQSERDAIAHGNAERLLPMRS